MITFNEIVLPLTSEKPKNNENPRQKENSFVIFHFFLYQIFASTKIKQYLGQLKGNSICM
jgi:hypothetical protein